MDKVKAAYEIPGWAVKGVEERAAMHGITPDEFVTETLEALFEHRPPEFKREETE